MLYTLLRCQRAVVISVPGLLKALTFQHYASVREHLAISIIYKIYHVKYNVIHDTTKKVS